LDEQLMQQFQEAMDEFAGHRQALERMRKDFAGMSVTVLSKDRVVEVTVGAGGVPTGMRFPDNKHKTMTGQQLATSVLQALTLARQEISTRMTESTKPLLGKGLGLAGTGMSDLDSDGLFKHLRSQGLLFDPSEGEV
jgi:DNA-binding protein YbaB